MSTIVDDPVLGVAVAVLAAITLFVPTFVAHARKLRAFRAVSALNALALLLVVVWVVPGRLVWGTSPRDLWALALIWAVAALWSFTGRRRDGSP